MDLFKTVIEKRWVPDKIISDSSISTIYLAYDRKRMKEAVVKVFKLYTGGLVVDEYRSFFSDLKIISGIDHPNIARVLGFGSLKIFEDEKLYIVYEHIAGRTVPDLYNQSIPPLDETMDIIKLAAEVLEAIHSKGIIHGSLHAKDILIDDSRSSLNITGLGSYSIYHTAPCEEGGIEHILYLPPEACSMPGRILNNSDDMYSLGVIFYFLLTAEYPFYGETIDAIRDNKENKKPALPSSLNPNVTSAIDSIVLRLIAKNPDERYQSAWKLIDDLKRVNGANMNALLYQDLNLFNDIEITGREKELSILEGFLSEGSPGAVCYITGDAGSGKTRLVNEFGIIAKKRGYVFIHGKCTQGGNKPPFQPFVSALETYSEIFKTFTISKKKDIAKIVSEELGDGIGALMRVLPALGSIIGESPPGINDDPWPARKSKNIIPAIIKMIRLLALDEQGLVIFIDDMQWIDSDSLVLVRKLINEIAPIRVILVCTSRSGEDSQDHLLFGPDVERENNHRNITSISLQPLDENYVRRFVSLATGADEPEVSDLSSFVYSITGGNPLFTLELIRYIYSSGVLVKDDERWIIKKNTAWSYNISADIIDVITGRIELVSRDEKIIFMLASAYGRPFSKHFIETLSDMYEAANHLHAYMGHPPGWNSIPGLLESGVLKRFIVSDPLKRDEYFFWHDKITESFYSLIPAGYRIDIHAIVACACEELLTEGDESLVFDTANHFIITGNHEKIIKYAPAAAQTAAKMNAFKESIRLYTIALENLEKPAEPAGFVDMPAWKNCMNGLGESLLISGEYDRSISIYHRLLEKTTSIIERVKIYEKLCTAYFKKGDWQKAEESGETGLSLLKESLPVNGYHLYFSSIKEFVQHLVLLLFTRYLLNDKKPDARVSARLAINFYNTLNWMYILSDTTKFIRSILRMLNISLTGLGKSPELALSIGAYASLCMAIPLFGRAEKYHRLALQMREELGDEWGIAQSLQWMGYMLQWKGDLEKSDAHFVKAINKFRKLGDAWETGMVIHGIELNHIYSGDYASAERHVERFIEISRMTGDQAGVCGGYNDLIRIRAEKGDFNGAREASETALDIIEKKSLDFHRCINESHTGFLHMMQGDYTQALERLESARRLYYKNRFVDHYVVQLFPDIAEAFILSRAGVGRQRNITSKKDLVEAKKMCLEAIKLTSKWPLHHGDALRVYALLCDIGGRNSRAERLFKAGIDMQKKHGRRSRLAVALSDYGHFLLKQGKTGEAVLNFRNAHSIYEELGADIYRNRIINILENISTRKYTSRGGKSSLIKHAGITGEDQPHGTETLKHGEPGIDNIPRGNTWSGPLMKESISIKDNGVIHDIPCRDIIYMASSGRYTIVNTNKRSYQALVQISRIEKEIPQNFLRIHKQYIVNADYVKSARYLDSKRYMVYLDDDDDTVLQSGRMYSDVIKRNIKHS